MRVCGLCDRVMWNVDGCGHTTTGCWPERYQGQSQSTHEKRHGAGIRTNHGYLLGIDNQGIVGTLACPWSVLVKR